MRQEPHRILVTEDVMAQDKLSPAEQKERQERIAEALRPFFDEARLRLAGVAAQARDGQLVEQTEMPIFEELNRLKRQCQEIALQERVTEAEAAFSPSSPPTKAPRQRPG